MPPKGESTTLPPGMDETANNSDADLRARDEWVAGLDLEGKEELLFEIDMLLRGLDRFFNLDNLFFSNREEIIQRDFTEEMGIVTQLLKRLVSLTAKLLDNSGPGDHHFQRFVQAQVADDLVRDMIVEKSLSQDTPRQSLYLLHDGLSQVQVITEALHVKERIAYPIFKSIGEIIRRQILLNRYFNPLQQMSFSPTYDRIHNRIIRDIVKAIPHGTLQRRISFVFLAFFRLLHYLRFINPKSADLGYLKSSLLVFALIRSEARAFLPYLDHGFKDQLFDFEGNLEADASMEIVTAEINDRAVALASELDSLSYQMTMELQKVSAEELANASEITRVLQLRGMVENAHGILQGFFQQAVVNLARIFEPDIEGRTIFPHFESRKAQSKRLLEDVMAFRTIMSLFEERMETDPNLQIYPHAVAYLKALKRFLEYFKDNTMLLLRFNDLTEFGEFLRVVHVLTPGQLKDGQMMQAFLLRTKPFRIYVETTIAQIRQRQDLDGVDANMRRVRHLVETFIAQADSDEAAAERSNPYQNPPAQE